MSNFDGFELYELKYVVFVIFLSANKCTKCNARIGEVTVRTKRTYCRSGDADSQQFELSYKLSAKINNNSGTFCILVVISDPSLAPKTAKEYYQRKHLLFYL